MFIFERERQTEHEWGRGRKRETQNPKQAPGCQHRAPPGIRTHKLKDHNLRLGGTLNQLSHPSTPPGLRVLTQHFSILNLHMNQLGILLKFPLRFAKSRTGPGILHF